MNFDLLAKYYDGLSRLVFRDRILKSKICFLKSIPKNSRILIIGGGTGEELDYITDVSSEVVFIEPSVKMIERSKKRRFNGRVEFFNGRFEEYRSEEKFDVCICHYFFDLYLEDKLIPIISKINLLTHSNSMLFIADFRETNQGWRSFYFYSLSRIMYIFFFLTTGLTTLRLPNIEQILSNSWNKKLIQEQMSGFIWSALYRRDSANPRTSR